VLLAGYAAFALVYSGWALANQGWHTWALFLLYGVYAAATDGVGKALVVDLVPRAGLVQRADRLRGAPGEPAGRHRLGPLRAGLDVRPGGGAGRRGVRGAAPRSGYPATIARPNAAGDRWRAPLICRRW